MRGESPGTYRMASGAVLVIERYALVLCGSQSMIQGIWEIPWPNQREGGYQGVTY